MSESWTDIEFEELELCDKRLLNRGKQLLAQLSTSPQDSIPQACRGASEIKAAYRFFSNKRISAESIHESHRRATLSRMSHYPTVLIPQDTTVLNFTSQPERKDTGPTTQDNSQGIYCHVSIAVTPDKVCLGALSLTRWHREKLQRLTRKQRREKNLSTPIEDKESYRWLDHCQQINAYASELPNTELVSIADREGDLYELYDRANRHWTAPNMHYVIRAHYDRRVCDETGRRTTNSIKQTLKRQGKLGEFMVNLPKTEKRKARQAKLTLYAKQVTVERPRDGCYDKNCAKRLNINAVYCLEQHPPKGAEALEWLLITDLPADNFEQALEKVQWYCCRWQIEIFFKTLKSGCTVEKLQLTDERFNICLAFYLIIAWRIMFMTMLSRTLSDESCELVFSQEEWQTIYVVLCKKVPPKKPPSLKKMTRMVAELGGYPNRKSDPEPGIKTLWRGIRAMQEYIKAREAFEQTFGGKLMGND